MLRSSVSRVPRAFTLSNQISKSVFQTNLLSKQKYFQPFSYYSFSTGKSSQESTFTKENQQLPSDELVLKGKEKIVGSWLLLTAGSVFLMIILGGYTRLSKSGLSMTKWKPIAYKYPSNQDEWDREFDNYKKFPEYQLSNKGMSLDDFKNIFLVEYVHRYLGQSIGFIFAVPFMSFIGLGFLKPKLTKRCLALLALGGTQGLIGWWMVKSGFKEKPNYQSRPRVSTYRLFVHLNTAVVIYSVLFWSALTLLRKPQENYITSSNLAFMKKIRRGALLLILLVSFNIMSGALVAGIDAGKVYNTWPLMNDQIIPKNYFDEKFPTSYANFIENTANVQFNHRNFAYLTYLASMALWLAGRRLPVPLPCKRALSLLFGIVNLQLLGGVFTLLYMVPVWLGVAHQGGALTVLSSGLYLLHTARNPSKAFLKTIKISAK